jgi:hypothetical protein
MTFGTTLVFSCVVCITLAINLKQNGMSDSAILGQRAVEDHCEKGNKLSGFIKGREFLG